MNWKIIPVTEKPSAFGSRWGEGFCTHSYVNLEDPCQKIHRVTTVNWDTSTLLCNHCHHHLLMSSSCCSFFSSSSPFSFSILSPFFLLSSNPFITYTVLTSVFKYFALPQRQRGGGEKVKQNTMRWISLNLLRGLTKERAVSYMIS